MIRADGFYEWKAALTQSNSESAKPLLWGAEAEEADGKGKAASKSKQPKQPYFISLKDKEPFAFAGLWEQWDSPEGQNIQSYSIITTDPNELMAPIHNRMPVILGTQDYSIG